MAYAGGAGARDDQGIPSPAQRSAQSKVVILEDDDFEREYLEHSEFLEPSTYTGGWSEPNCARPTSIACCLILGGRTVCALREQHAPQSPSHFSTSYNLLLRVIGTSDERSGLDVSEAYREALAFFEAG